MREVAPKELEQGRVRNHPVYTSNEGVMHGMFVVKPGKYKLRIISSGKRHDDEDFGTGNQYLKDIAAWEHVSVSVIGKHFCPSWEEMCFVKNLFWDEEETVIQFHPPKSEYVNMHEYVLHLWKPPYSAPTPPGISIGISEIRKSKGQ
jgi:hypothetical protein